MLFMMLLQEVEMADALRADGKIYVVVVIFLLILIALFLYLYRLEKKIVNKPSIFRALNWIRIKANKPPLKRNTTHQSSEID